MPLKPPVQTQGKMDTLSKIDIKLSHPLTVGNVIIPFCPTTLYYTKIDFSFSNYALGFYLRPMVNLKLLVIVGHLSFLSKLM